MSAFRIWSTAILGWCILTGLAQAEPDADPREKLETVIPEAIRLLEAKEYVKYFNTFLAPEDIKKVTKSKSIDEIAQIFGERTAPRMLEVLKSVKDVQPTISADGNSATYELKDASGNMTTIRWKKVDKYWYLRK